MGPQLVGATMFEVPEHTKLRRLGLIKVSIGTDGHRPGTGRESSRTEPSSRDETPPASIHMLLMSLAHAIWTCVERSIVFPRGVSSLFLSNECLKARRTSHRMREPLPLFRPSILSVTALNVSASILWRAVTLWSDLARVLPASPPVLSCTTTSTA